MIKTFLYIVNALLSFGAGFFAYVFMLDRVWHQTLGGDMAFVLIYGAAAFLLAGVPVYLGVIKLVDLKIKKWKAVFYPLSCMVVFFIPTLFITLRFGSANIISPEAVLFNSFFLSSGLVFGLMAPIINKVTNVSNTV